MIYIEIYLLLCLLLNPIVFVAAGEDKIFSDEGYSLSQKIVLYFGAIFLTPVILLVFSFISIYKYFQRSGFQLIDPFPSRDAIQKEAIVFIKTTKK